MSIFPTFTINFKDKLKDIKKYIIEHGTDEEIIDMTYLLDIESILKMDTELKYAGTFYDRFEDGNFMLFQTQNNGDKILPLSIGFSVDFLDNPKKKFKTIIHNLELFGEHIKITYEDFDVVDLSVYRETYDTYQIFKSSIQKRVAISLNGDLENINIFEMEDGEITHLRFLI